MTGNTEECDGRASGAKAEILCSSAVFFDRESGTRNEASSLRQADAVHQVLKARIGVQSIELRFGLNLEHGIRAFIVSSVQPRDRLGAISQTCIDCGDFVRCNIFLLRERL